MEINQVLQGDCLELMRSLEDNSIDAIVTDPPAGISFMGKDWDGDKGGRKQWCAYMEERFAEALRVCKPGAHALV
jgi:DNA modification methylase